MSKTYILYKDVPPGAAEGATVTTNGAQDFSTLALPTGVENAHIATLEPNGWGLDGTFKVQPQPVAFWSAEQSNGDCTFETPPTITITLDQQYSSTGISLVFDPNGRCDLVNIQWWQGDTQKADMDFEVDADTFFCRHSVTSYDKIVLTLKRTSLPARYAKVQKIYLGAYRRFDMWELRQGQVSISQETDLSGLELPVSTLRWRLDSREEADYLFQFRQPVEVHNGDRLIGTYYIDDSDRITGSLYDINTFDAFGVLGESAFPGGVYTDKSSRELLQEIVDGAFELTINATGRYLTGAILPCTRREAIQQVLFAWGARAATDGTGGIRVFGIQTGPHDEIGPDRTFPGARVSTSAAYTAVRVTAHSYVQDDNGTVEIGGIKYRDDQTVYTVANPDATAADRENVKEIAGGTLVSPDIGQTVAQRVADYLFRRHTAKPKIVWQGEKLGQLVSVPNDWGGTTVGHITKMDIKLSNTVVVDCEVRGR